MGAIKEPYEHIAQDYAILIKNGIKTIDDVPLKPSILKPRVIELINE